MYLQSIFLLRASPVDFLKPNLESKHTKKKALQQPLL